MAAVAAKPVAPKSVAPKPGHPATDESSYLELVFDHATVAVVAGSVRRASERTLRPASRDQMKLICDPEGNVTIQVSSDDERDVVTIATARWRDDAMCDRRQDAGVPDDFQWIALEDGLRAELARSRVRG